MENKEDISTAELLALMQEALQLLGRQNKQQLQVTKRLDLLEKRLEDIENSLIGFTGIVGNLNEAIDANRITLSEILKFLRKDKGFNMHMN
ncbi:MAG: hypothetical protein HC896_03745 [Bacteroidales bacterium]|nr:hypothetical protein [Bacteroidales bacterium]